MKPSRRIFIIAALAVVVGALTVDYRCGEKRKRASAIEGTGLELSCP